MPLGPTHFGCARFGFLMIMEIILVMTIIPPTLYGNFYHLSFFLNNEQHNVYSSCSINLITNQNNHDKEEAINHNRSIFFHYFFLFTKSPLLWSTLYNVKVTRTVVTCVHTVHTQHENDKSGMEKYVFILARKV